MQERTPLFWSSDMSAAKDLTRSSLCLEKFGDVRPLQGFAAVRALEVRLAHLRIHGVPLQVLLIVGQAQLPVLPAHPSHTVGLHVMPDKARDGSWCMRQHVTSGGLPAPHLESSSPSCSHASSASLLGRMTGILLCSLRPIEQAPKLVAASPSKQSSCQ